MVVVVGGGGGWGQGYAGIAGIRVLTELGTGRRKKAGGTEGTKSEWCKLQTRVCC
jgi:hypothetical protein